MILDNL